jgi:hypothetical protein
VVSGNSAQITPMSELRDLAGRVILSVGDMIHDARTGSKGFLKERQRKIDIIEDDIYVWTIIWFSQDEKYRQYNNPAFIEEEGLKMSIIIGTVNHYKKE